MKQLSSRVALRTPPHQKASENARSARTPLSQSCQTPDGSRRRLYISLGSLRLRCPETREPGDMLETTPPWIAPSFPSEPPSGLVSGWNYLRHHLSNGGHPARTLCPSSRTPDGVELSGSAGTIYCKLVRVGMGDEITDFLYGAM